MMETGLSGMFAASKLVGFQGIDFACCDALNNGI